MLNDLNHTTMKNIIILNGNNWDLRIGNNMRNKLFLKVSNSVGTIYAITIGFGKVLALTTYKI